MSVSFASILDTNLDDVKPPKPIPAGNYIATITGLPEHTQLGDKEMPALVWPIKLLQLVDPDPTLHRELAEALNGRNLGDTKLNITKFVPPDNLYNLKLFLRDHLGIEAHNVREAISETPNKQVMVTLVHKPGRGEEGRIFLQVGSTAHA
jgi:hypothetical protein